jgi:hypothetical protein
VSGLRRALWALGCAGLLAGAAAAALTLSSAHVRDPWVGATLGSLVGWSFIFTGLFAWWRRPDERTGALMAAVGFAWFAASLATADASWVFTLGLLVGNVYLPACIHLLLSFPHGRLRSRGERQLVGGAYVLSVVGPLPLLMLGGPGPAGTARARLGDQGRRRRRARAGARAAG